MKKLLAFVLAMIMLLSFVGCGNQEEVKEGLTIEDVVGYWESPNRVDYGVAGDIAWTNYSLTFYEDGSGLNSHYFYGDKTDNVFTYEIKNNTVEISNVIYGVYLVLTYDDSSSTPKLRASMAEGYWYEKVSE